MRDDDAIVKNDGKEELPLFHGKTRIGKNIFFEEGWQGGRMRVGTDALLCEILLLWVVVVSWGYDGSAWIKIW